MVDGAAHGRCHDVREPEPLKRGELALMRRIANIGLPQVMRAAGPRARGRARSVGNTTGNSAKPKDLLPSNP